jgi:hypothetical protein
MREIVEVLLSIGVPTGGLVWYALVLARREAREAGGEKETTFRRGPTIIIGPDPDAHLGRVGSE